MLATVKTVVDGLKAQPLALALVVVNALFIAAGVWVLREIAANARDRDAAERVLWQQALDCRTEKRDVR